MQAASDSECEDGPAHPASRCTMMNTAFTAMQKNSLRALKQREQDLTSL